MTIHIDQFSLSVETRALAGHTNTYLVDTTKPTHNQGALLIDPAARSGTLDTVVTEKNIGHIAVTHTHRDHIGAVAEYAAEADATVWARRGREGRFESRTGIRPDESFTEGTRIGPVVVIDTPGHARDHVAFTVAGNDTGYRRKRIISGDLAVADESVVVASPEGDMRSYLTALRRLYARHPSKLYPGHGPPIRCPRETLGRLIAHRLDREQLVLDAVETGVESPDAIVERVYEKEIGHVRDLARATVVAHLEKLAHEGHVRLAGRNRWVPDT